MPATLRVLVTGATGYIGGRLVPRLYDHGYTVRCFARAAHRLRGRFPSDAKGYANTRRIAPTKAALFVE